MALLHCQHQMACNYGGPVVACASCNVLCCASCLGLSLLQDPHAGNQAKLLEIMKALGQLGVRCSTCRLIGDAAAQAKWGGYMWLPSPEKRITSHPDAEVLRQWAFGEWNYVSLYGNASAALAIVAERSNGRLLYSVGGYGTASMADGRCIDFTTAKLKKDKLSVSRFSLYLSSARELQRRTNAASMLPSQRGLRSGTLVQLPYMEISQMHSSDALSLEERQSLLALTIHAITSQVRIGGLVVELVLGGYGMALRVRFFRRLLVLCKVLQIPVVVDEALSFGRTRVARDEDAVPGAANCFLVEAYVAQDSTSWGETAIAYLVGGKAIGCGILLERKRDAAVFQTTTPELTTEGQRVAEICLHEMRHSKTTLEVLADGVRRDRIGYVWEGVGALLYAVSGGGGGGGGGGGEESVVPGRVLPSLLSPNPGPALVQRGEAIRKELGKANRIALDYLLGVSDSDSAHIRGWLCTLLSDASEGKGACSAAGIGATNIVDAAPAVAVWKNSWFSWMGEANEDQRGRRTSLNAFLDLEAHITHQLVGTKRQKLRSFTIAGFKGVTCGVVERAVLTNACSAD